MNKSRYFILAFLLVTLSQLHAQQFGNEWIVPSQTYFKIWVHEDGIYRVSYNELQAAGFPVASINPQNFQLWFRGEQRAIRIEGEADGSFDPSDYIEFYGQQNDGTLDVELYTRDPADQIHPEYNLYADQTAYFLTYVTGVNGERFDEFYEGDSTSTPLSYHIEHAEADMPANFRKRERNFASGAELPEIFPFNTNGGNYSDFRDARGWGSIAVFNRSLRGPVGINVSNYVFGTSETPILTMRVAGRFRGKHIISIITELTGRSLDTIQFDGHSNGIGIFELREDEVPSSGNGLMGIRYRIEDAEPLIGNEAISLHGMLGTYPQATDAGGSNSKLFYLPTGNAKSRLLIDNPASNARLIDITNPNQPTQINADYLLSGQLNAIVPNTSSESRKILMTNEVKTIDSVRSVRFNLPSVSSANYFLVYHKSLATPSANYSDPIQAYIDFRSSPEGGSFNVIAKEIGDLYNEFTYGEHNPIALRRFARYLFSQGATPEYLFLVGSGLELIYQTERGANASSLKKNLVPCLGYPCADNIITQGLNGSHSYVPAIPTGRLSARTSQHVDNYLRKVIQYQDHEFNSFDRKDLIFLTGGITSSERLRMASYGNNFNDIIEEKFLGGKGQIISKKTSFSVELVDISDLVNNGIGMITFFGHSSPGILDIDIGFVTDPNNGYNNEGKYPLIWVNGCDAGAMFTPSETLGENWTLTENKGAVLYAAHADLGFENALRIYTVEMLNTIYGESASLNQSFGKALNSAQAKIGSRFPTDPLMTTHIQQFALQGDPALLFFGTDKAEYAITDESLSIEPADLSGLIRASSDSFNIKIAIDNYGAVVDQEFSIGLTRTFSDGSKKTYPNQIFDPVYYQDTVCFVVRNTEEDKAKAIGLNNFEITIDVDNEIPETDETTNVASIDYFFTNSSLQILSPKEFSIVNQQPVSLIAQNANALTSPRDYTFQLDTTDQFNSPALQETTVNATILPSWDVNLLTDNNTDSIVYYWRVQFTNPTSIDDPSWVDASFLYIKNGPEGWSQSHFPQFKKNTEVNLIDNQLNRRWEFSTDTIKIRLNTVGIDHPDQFMNSIAYDDFTLIDNGIEQCGANSRFARTKDNLLLVPMDANTGELYNPLIILDAGAQSYVCGDGPEKPVGRVPGSTLSNSLNFFDSAVSGLVQSGDYLILMSSGNVPFSSLSATTLSSLERLGFNAADFGTKVQTGEPFIGIGRKDVAGYTAPIITPDRTSGTPANAQQLSYTFNYIFDVQSSVTSTLIGPANSWRSVISSFTEYDSPSDFVKLDLIGIDNTGNSSVLLENLQTSPSFDIGSVNATQYPYIRLRTTLEDDDLNTAVQMRKWQVLYQPYPEGLLYATTPNTISNPTEAQEGQPVSYDFVFKNISGEDFTDPVIVEYQVKLANNSVDVFYDTLSILPAFDSLSFSKEFSTLGYGGINSVTAFANPYLQNEQNYANNVAQQFFTVATDSLHPVLDVVFDGRHIMNGEIVSASPVISISGKDDNQFLSLSDTNNLDVYLSDPSTGNLSQIDLGSSSITWITQSVDEFRLDFKPDNLADGIYTLRVQLRDASENQSGTVPYEITFEVINKSTITHFYPYPNPFSTNVRFVFTLTGNTIPDEMKIQIMTVTGRVVREITQDEIGAITIGNNITEYAWDGKDEFGDQLANGVYLYRVITRANGQELERRATSKDNLFKEGFGKMYLIR